MGRHGPHKGQRHGEGDATPGRTGCHGFEGCEAADSNDGGECHRHDNHVVQCRGGVAVGPDGQEVGPHKAHVHGANGRLLYTDTGPYVMTESTAVRPRPHIGVSGYLIGIPSLDDNRHPRVVGRPLVQYQTSHASPKDTQLGKCPRQTQTSGTNVALEQMDNGLDIVCLVRVFFLSTRAVVICFMGRRIVVTSLDTALHQEQFVFRRRRHDGGGGGGDGLFLGYTLS